MGHNKKPINKLFLIIFCFIISLFLASCNNKSEENSSLEKDFQQSELSANGSENKTEEKFLLEKGWLQHEFVANGKRISFILPEHYVSAGGYNDMIARGSNDIEALDRYYSMKNNKNRFEITIESCSDFIDTTIDAFFENRFYTYTDCYMVPFIEKKYDKNNHAFCLVMSSKIVRFPEQSDEYIYSNFSYVTILGKKLYSCRLSAHEPIDNNFSYEEKRKIIGSVRIEDIK